MTISAVRALNLTLNLTATLPASGLVVSTPRPTDIGITKHSKTMTLIEPLYARDAPLLLSTFRVLSLVAVPAMALISIYDTSD